MYKLQLMVPALAILLFRFPAAGQTGGVAGPMLGYMPDGAAGVRPVLGIPGASLTGERQGWDFEAAAVEIAPGQDYALAVDVDGAVRRVDLGGAPLASRVLEGAMASPDRILMSPSGRRALLVSGDALEGQVVSGGEMNPVDLSLFPDKPRVLAVSDAGDVLGATTNGLFLLAAGELRALPSTGEITALAFLPGGRDAYAAGPGQLALVSGLDGTPGWRLIAALPEEFGRPLAVASGGRRAVVASSGAAMIVDSDGGASTRFECAVARLSPLSGEAFRLGDYGEGPVWMLDAGGSEPRLLFIPPAAPAVEEVEQ